MSEQYEVTFSSIVVVVHDYSKFQITHQKDALMCVMGSKKWKAKQDVENSSRMLANSRSRKAITEKHL